MKTKKLAFHAITALLAGSVLLLTLNACKSTQEVQIEREKAVAKAAALESPASKEAKKAMSLPGSHFIGKNCRAGPFDLPEDSSESLVFDEDGISVHLDGTGHGISSRGTYVIDAEKKEVIMTFNENGSGVLVGTYKDEECSELFVEGKVHKAIISLTGRRFYPPVKKQGRDSV